MQFPINPEQCTRAEFTLLDGSTLIWTPAPRKSNFDKIPELEPPLKLPAPDRTLPGPGRRLSKQEKQQIKTLYTEGHTISFIADALNCTPTTVKRYI